MDLAAQGKEKKNNKEKQQNDVIWFVSVCSMDGLFLENGPFRVEKNLSLSINEGGWQNYATNIYGKYLCLF